MGNASFAPFRAVNIVRSTTHRSVNAGKEQMKTAPLGTTKILLGGVCSAKLKDVKCVLPMGQSVRTVVQIRS